MVLSLSEENPERCAKFVSCLSNIYNAKQVNPDTNNFLIEAEDVLVAINQIR